MKHQVLPGETVVLDLGQRAKVSHECSSRARVKSVQKLSTTAVPAYGVAVEFETAGNVWDITSAPEDWFPAQGSKVAEPNPGRELRLITRTDPQVIQNRSERAAAVPVLTKNGAAASLSPWFSDMMAGLSNQIQVTVSEIAAVALAKEKKRLLDEF